MIKHTLHRSVQTEAAHADRTVYPGAVFADALNFPADQTIDLVGSAALDDGLAVGAFDLDDPDPHPATVRGHVVVNHMDPSLLTNSRLGHPPVTCYNLLGTLIISLYLRIAFQADLVMTANRNQV